jgi:SAM-dependent methyltransferase
VATARATVLHRIAVAADGDHLYCSLAWVTCSTPQRCTTRTICTSLPPGDLSEFAAHGPVVPGAGFQGAVAAELAWRLLDLRPGMRVLDLACRHTGELANRLAERGCQVTGLDSSAVFLDRARADAAAAGVSVEYVAGDMRQIPWTGRFDRVVNWSTALGTSMTPPIAPSWMGSFASCGRVAGWPWTWTT